MAGNRPGNDKALEGSDDDTDVHIMGFTRRKRQPAAPRSESEDDEPMAPEPISAAASKAVLPSTRKLDSGTAGRPCWPWAKGAVAVRSDPAVGIRNFKMLMMEHNISKAAAGMRRSSKSAKKMKPTSTGPGKAVLTEGAEFENATHELPPVQRKKVQFANPNSNSTPAKKVKPCPSAQRKGEPSKGLPRSIIAKVVEPGSNVKEGESIYEDDDEDDDDDTPQRKRATKFKKKNVCAQKRTFRSGMKLASQQVAMSSIEQVLDSRKPDRATEQVYKFVEGKEFRAAVDIVVILLTLLLDD